jgi:predicted lipoprotein with Yx(FWY)xxD motif
MGLKSRWWSVVALAGAVVLAGCGDDSGTTTTGAAAGGGSPTTSAAADSGGGYYGGTPTTAAATTTSAAAAGAVKVAQTSLGSVLTDDKGRTLYVFLRDEKNKSNCTGGCLTTWPPYTVSDVAAGAGVDASLLGSIATADGKKQLTISGAPLYYFSGDAAAGDTKGQGVGGNWYVVDAKGAAIK